MGAAALRYAKTHRKPGPPSSREDQRARDILRREAAARGAVLKSNGEGGLPASLALFVFRRDRYTCKVHGDHGEGAFGGLTLHHKGGIVESAWLSRQGHSNDPSNIVTLCDKAHNTLHDDARAAGVDSSQVEPTGDRE